MLLAQCDDMVTHSRRIVPINLSAKQFCHGEPGTMCLSRIPMARSHGNTVDPRTARGSGSVGSRFREMLQ